MKKKPKSDPYADLGVPRDATKDTIKKAFRQKVKQHHPDKPGGDKEAFLPIARAYDLLTDDERRARYDQLGEDDERDLEKEAVQTLVRIIMEVIECSDVRRTDMMNMSRRYILKQQSEGTATIGKLKMKITHWQEAGRRTKAKADNFLAAAINVRIHDIKINIKDIEYDLELSRAMLKLLADFKYVVDKTEEPGWKNNYGMKPMKLTDVLGGLNLG